MKFALFVAIILSAVMAFFAVQNSQHTQVTFLGWYFDGPLVIVLLLTFGTGVTATFLAMLPGSWRKAIEISKLKSQLASSNARIDDLEKQHQANKKHIMEGENDHSNEQT